MLLDHCLLLLDDLLELLLAQLVEELLVEHWHHAASCALLLLGHQLLKKLLLLVFLLGHVRDGIELAFFDPSASLPSRLLPHRRLHRLLRLRGDLLRVALRSAGITIRLGRDELLVALSGLTWLRSSWTLASLRLLPVLNTAGLRANARRCLHEPLQWIGVAD